MNIKEIQKIVINLPERSDRLIQFNEEYNKIFEDKYTIIEGVKNRLPFKGIAQAHLNCINYAKNNKLDNILIMEDDLKIVGSNTINYINDCLYNIPDEYDILLGGVYTSAQLINYNQYWSQTKDFSGLQFYIVNKKAYNTILKYDNNGHIDKWLANNNGANLKCYVTNYFFAIQHNGYSDNVQNDTNYDHLLQRFKLLP